MIIKVISLNLWNGGQLFDQAAQFLQTQQADIMLLQEAYDGHGNIDVRFKTIELLSQLFPSHSVFFSPMFLDTRKKEGKIENGQLVLSKFPLSHPQTIYFDIPHGEYDHDRWQDFTRFPAGMQTATIQIKHRQIKLINVHGPVNYNGLADTPRRLKMREAILKTTLDNVKIIMAGDFNARPQTKTIKGIENQLINVFQNQLNTTFNLKRKDLKTQPGYADAAVDMMFVSPKIKILTKSCPQADISDHLPLVVTLDV